MLKSPLTKKTSKLLQGGRMKNKTVSQVMKADKSADAKMTPAMMKKDIAADKKLLASKIKKTKKK